MFIREIPMSELDAAKVRTTLAQNAAEAAVQFPQILSRLGRLLRRHYPPHLLAAISGWTMLGAARRPGAPIKPMVPGLEQHHVELLQAMVLMMPRNQWGSEPAEPREIQAIIDALQGLATSFNHKRLGSTPETTSPDEKMAFALRERIRDHTQMIRNWAAHSEMLRISRMLHASLDHDLNQAVGFGASDVVDVVETATEIVETRLKKRFATLQKVFRGKTVDETVRRYFDLYPGVAGDPDAYLKSLHADASLEEVRFRLLGHADRWTVTCFSVSSHEIAEACGHDAPLVAKILDRISIEPGDLGDVDPERLFLGNPVWERPACRMDGEYFFTAVHTVASYLPTILRSICDEAGLRLKLERRRARFLEEQVHEILASALPGATMSKGVKWEWDARRYETDTIALYDRVLIIAEAKSAVMSAAGLRGGTDRMRKHVADLIVGPSQQSARLQDVVSRANAGDPKALATARSIGIEPALVDTVIRVSVTLDDASMLASAEGELKRAQWVPEDLELAATLSLPELLTVADILVEPIHLLHYLKGRGPLQRASPVYGQELDFLGLYLTSRFHLPEIEAGTHKVCIIGMSSAVDEHHLRTEAGMRVRKPKVRMGRYLSSVLGRLAHRAQPAWTSIALALLDSVDPDIEADLGRQMSRRRDAAIRRAGRGAPDGIVVAAPPLRDCAAAFYVGSELDRASELPTLDALADDMRRDHGTRRLAVVIRRVEQWDVPYSAAGIAC